MTNLPLIPTDDYVEAAKKILWINFRVNIWKATNDDGISNDQCYARFSDVLGMRRVP